MNAILQSILDKCNAATVDEQPDYLVIHSLDKTQVASWDDWAIQQADMLTRNGWRQRRLGTGLHLIPSVLLEGAE